MSRRRHLDRLRLASEEAAYWYIRSNDERAMVLADRRQFFAWLKRSPDNIAEVLRISEMDGKLARQRLVDRIQEMDESNVIELELPPGARARNNDQFSELDDDDEQDETMKNNSTARPWKFAAAIAMVALSFLLAFVVNSQWFDDTIETGPSQWQHMTLADGSVVHVDSRSRLKVEFSRERRLVHLYAGQAVFEVVKDKSRPFTVSTEVIDSTAVGTRFGVSIDSGVTTTVSEGAVKITPHGQYDFKKPVMLRAGDELHVSDSGLTQQAEAKVARVNAEARLEWADGWWRFQGQTIGEAVREFNRRNATQVEIMEPDIADRRITLYRFRVDQPEAFIKLIGAQEGLATEIDRSNNRVRLRNKQ